ncbi:mucin-7-like [Mytilus edulis]|uniref:mucin-7-like n=1 Tax=Mytilus edulis TaxID=6550 RepID=UPI0039EE40A1
MQRNECKDVINSQTTKIQIQNMASYQVQYGTRRQVATAVVIGSGTETEMIQMKTSRETSESSREASTKPPTLPSTQHTGQPYSFSLPTTRRPAKRKRTTNTPMRQSKTSRIVPLSKTAPSESTTRPSVSTSRTAPSESTTRPSVSTSRTAPSESTTRPSVSTSRTAPSESTTRPSVSTSRTAPSESTTRPSVSTSRTAPSESTTRPSVSTSVPPTSLTPTQPTTTMYAGSSFPDEDKIIKLLHVIIEQNTKLEHKLEAINRRLMTNEAKQNTMIDLLQRCDKFLEYDT